MGGGQDRDQALCARDLAEGKRDALHAAAARGAVVFAVCGGYQLLGHGYELDGERLPGAGLVDLETVREPGERLIGNVAISLDLPGGPRVLAGFENHGGRTYLGPGVDAARAGAARARQQRRDGAEGVRGGPHGTVVGTYIHGPLLPEEHRVRRLAHGDRARPRAGVRWRRSTTSWRPPRTEGARRAAGV